jgi:hypothetical protein
MMMNGKKACILSLALILTFSNGSLFIFHAIASTSATIDATVKVAVCGNGDKETREQCDGSDFDLNICTTYSFSGGTLACQPSCELNTSSCTTAAEVTAIPLFFTGVGGSYELENEDGDSSLLVDLPPDYYSQDVRLQLFSYANDHFSVTKPAPGGTSFVGKTYDIVFVNEDGYVVTSFANAADVVLSYRDADIGSLEESTLQPYRWGPSDASWQPIAGAVLDTANNTVTFTTVLFSSFALFGSPPAAAPPPSGGGGGGLLGGGGTVAPATVVLSGFAYPGSEVSVLRDAVLVKVTEADLEGRFRVTLTEPSGGSYGYIVYAVDDLGLRSTLMTFFLTLAPGITNQKDGILLSPTVSVDKVRVKQGESLTVTGRSVPSSQVVVTAQAGETKTAIAMADTNGRYTASFDTALFPKDSYLLNAKSILGSLESPTSRSVTFDVGDVTEMRVSSAVLIGDMNGDRRVNLIDFSILAYWYKRPNPQPAADLNKDGKVDLVDVSIMIFHWTG